MLLNDVLYKRFSDSNKLALIQLTLPLLQLATFIYMRGHLTHCSFVSTFALDLHVPYNSPNALACFEFKLFYFLVSSALGTLCQLLCAQLAVDC